ncbi:thiamine biosynthesis protein ThiF [Haematobacter massiliensis]|uniref:Thiamine biosynthesis protein ThiF n=1 Tax=Haematobacter massiliensis TaxID=195105 RepID=A0A086Y504_9RHOB|nr:HesA/MoeB/ThiF family protein [Haematobacter massiliensis]KFI29354.1 thiamine biosynthesis protein ThiF [Haematobacter massiliensis]OWJ71164.1 thiamine biosynthesis protein ThiF [Haematobacter massiliensis]OWJ84298.1 thiamine biosynthesis protein ThiF [Haematobacter massiliensis]QBJ25971.1 HesA/MoeB/ThiF family protein [Haematobacter massiliensis]
MSRYARQIAVPGFGAAAQERLGRATALVVGAGGLAAPVLQYLAGAGVGRLRIVDPDRVEESNLHRQTLFRHADIGHPKAEAAARTLGDLNPETVAEPVVAALHPGNVDVLVAGADVVLDCADSFAVSYILSDTCLRAGLALVSASVIGTEGYAGTFCDGAPSLRAVFPELPPRLGSCAEDGVLGPVVGVVGAVQAQMALTLLAGLEPTPRGRIVSYDGLAQRFGGFSFLRAEEVSGPGFIHLSEIRNNDFTVDLRAEHEGEIVRSDARRLTVADFVDGAPLPEAGQRAVLCCRSGQRAWSAAERLATLWPGEIVLVALGDHKEQP